LQLWKSSSRVTSQQSTIHVQRSAAILLNLHWVMAATTTTTTTTPTSLESLDSICNLFVLERERERERIIIIVVVIVLRVL
jgi:hypothetical protein